MAFMNKARPALQYLITYESSFEKCRLGNKNDGGYVIARLPNEPYDAYISAGVSNEESFTRDFLQLYQSLSLSKENCFAFDGTIEDYPYEYTRNITFIKKNIGPNNTETTTNLLDILSRFEHIFLKMDIEGAEYEWLLSILNQQPDVLKNVKQITMEFHGINDDSWSTPYEKKVECFHQLSKTHYIIHAHGNNWAPRTGNIPDVLELTFLRKYDFFNETTKINTNPLPCSLDSPNKSDAEDYVLEYPFAQGPQRDCFVIDNQTQNCYRRIPKTIYQTWKCPFEYTRTRMMEKNPGYTYEFYDDKRMDEYMKTQPDHVRYCYEQLTVGAARADFWRYIILYEKGGIYVDIDSEIIGSLDELISPIDRAIISREGNPEYFLQWMLAFEPRNPILQRTIDICIDNIRFHKTNDIFFLTGPAVFTQAVKELTDRNAYHLTDNYLNDKYQHICRFYKRDFPKYGLFKHDNTYEIYSENFHWKDENRPILKPAICTFRDLGKQGRLGNVLFQYAALLGFAAKMGTTPKIPEDIDTYEHHSQKCLLRRFPITAESISTPVPMDYHENCPGGNYDANLWSNAAPLTNLCGQYESEYYFAHIREKIKKEFTLELSNIKQEWLGIHFRRGDDVTINNHIYTTESYNIEFMNEAIAYLKHTGRYEPNREVIIFTGGSRTNDMKENQMDRQWCENFMKRHHPMLRCRISELDAFDDFKKMQKCENFIINSSSSMGWWAGYLNQIPNKCILVAPSTNKSSEYWPKEFTVIEPKGASEGAAGLVHIFTCLTDRQRIEYLRKTAKKNGAKIEYILSSSWNGYKDKIEAMREAIKKLKDDEIACFIDAYDVLINHSTEEIKNRFLQNSCEIIFGAEMCCYPEKHLSRHNEHNNNTTNKKTNHVYLNAGGYIGYVRAIKKMLYWKSDDEIYNSCSDGTDQAYMMEYMFEHPEVKLDTEANIFLNMHKVDWKDIEVRNGKIKNIALENEPCIVHFNGGYWQTNQEKNILPIITDKILENKTEKISEICIHPEKCMMQKSLTVPKAQQTVTNAQQTVTNAQQTVPLAQKVPLEKGLKYIDHVFYINLNRRPDRREEMEEQLKRYNIEAERFEAIDRPEPTKGIVGCTMSHMEVLKLAKSRNYQTVFILEDDFEFQVSPNELRRQINEIFENNVRFDVCMLGYKIEEQGESKYPFLIRSLRTQSASAYIITYDFYEKVIDLFKWAIPLLDETGEHWNYANDQIWNRLQPEANWYCLTPRVGKQRDGYSDNSETTIIYDC